MKAKDHFTRTLFGHTGRERLLRQFIELVSTRDVRAMSVPRPSGPKTQKERNNSMKTFSKISLSAAALALLGIAASSPRGDEGKDSGGRWKTIVIDVAMDGRALSVNTASPTDTEPKRGATGTINGKMYPGGTIAAGDGLD